ncbi:DoxX family protein [Marinomonas pollencensis]|uniref:DoxX-like protein n=1 Tax=Marinomonas pollencensis TaxID=491954 RepID=A0A3E0DGJ3_9GAMM|nr:DoxX family protein [Marinomonas pollencensis]REG81807.1 DoxX-like protein [Marinomonas pollencensis]
MSSTAITPNTVSKPLNISIWIFQLLGAGVFVMAGVMKTMIPIDQLSEMMPWTGQYPLSFVHFLGLVDFAGGLGLILPSLTRIAPRLTVIAAVCVLLQLIAICFHSSRGEFNVLPVNAVYISLALLVLWGRGKKAPISSR